MVYDQRVWYKNSFIIAASPVKDMYLIGNELETKLLQKKLKRGISTVNIE